MSPAERVRIEARLQTIEVATPRPPGMFPMAKGGVLLAVLVGLGVGLAHEMRVPVGGAPPAPVVAPASPTPAAQPDAPRMPEVPSVNVEALPSVPRAKVVPHVADPAPHARVREEREEREERRDVSREADPLLREIAALDAARASLATDPAVALVLLDAQQKEFAAGQLGAERELLSVRALVRLGRLDDARTRGEAFMRAHGASPYGERMQRELAALTH